MISALVRTQVRSRCFRSVFTRDESLRECTYRDDYRASKTNREHEEDDDEMEPCNAMNSRKAETLIRSSDEAERDDAIQR
ncbi:hypothetical protein L1987_21386 [Smallanthus sonchifolius]|uniref:Uncharacterized protein n=1 Tax=Smallanthus sonchifolius TaxID=185202 RepID=A0ACB9ITS4_9ASTR|nr:hypothetical protein L1987_21386 [Smallanthus sonchifolius]